MKAALFKTSLICPCLLSPPKAHYLDKVVKGMALLLSLSFLLLFRSVSHHFPIISSFKCIRTAPLTFKCHLTPLRHYPQPITAFSYSHNVIFSLSTCRVASERARASSLGFLLWKFWGRRRARRRRSRTSPIGAMHNGCSAQLCSTAQWRAGGGGWVRRGSEATASLIKACHAPVMLKPPPPTPPTCSFFSSFILVSLPKPSPHFLHRVPAQPAWAAGVTRGGSWPSGAVSARRTGELRGGHSLKRLPIRLNRCQRCTDLYLFRSLISIRNKPSDVSPTQTEQLFVWLRSNRSAAGQAHPSSWLWIRNTGTKNHLLAKRVTVTACPAARKGCRYSNLRSVIVWAPFILLFFYFGPLLMVRRRRNRMSLKSTGRKKVNPLMTMMVSRISHTKSNHWVKDHETQSLDETIQHGHI